jgi:hypothetical protein
MVLYCNWRSLMYLQPTFVGFYGSPAHRVLVTKVPRRRKKDTVSRRHARHYDTTRSKLATFEFICETISRGDQYVLAVSLLDFGNGIHFRPLDPEHRRLLPRHDIHCRIARSGTWFQPRWHFHQSAYAQARLSAYSRRIHSMERMAVGRAQNSSPSGCPAFVRNSPHQDHQVFRRPTV